MRWKTMESSTFKLTVAIAKWRATTCRPNDTLEDKGLCNIRSQITSNNRTYELPSRTAVIHKLYEAERAKHAEELEMTAMVALTGDHWTSLGNNSYLWVTAYSIDEQFKQHSNALTILKEGRDIMPDILWMK